MTSERTRQPSWRGDVTAGVDAWLGSTPRVSPPEDTATQSPDADPEAVARKILLDQLAGRARSRSELADKLKRRNVPDEIATPLLDRFEDVGLIDDGAFAEAWVSSRQSSKQLGKRALRQELRRKGVGDDEVAAALDGLEPDAEWEAAQEYVRKRRRSMERLEASVAARRLSAGLARKGHSADIIRRAMADFRDPAED